MKSFFVTVGLWDKLLVAPFDFSGGIFVKFSDLSTSIVNSTADENLASNMCGN